MFITPDLIAKLRTIDKAGNPETIFIGPNSMAEVPTSSSSLRAIEKNRSQDWRLCRLARESSSGAVRLDLHDSSRQNSGAMGLGKSCPAVSPPDVLNGDKQRLFSVVSAVRGYHSSILPVAFAPLPRC